MNRKIVGAPEHHGTSVWRVCFWGDTAPSGILAKKMVPRLNARAPRAIFEYSRIFTDYREAA